MLFARQRLHERALAQAKTLLSARGTLQDLYGYINSRMTIPAPGQKEKNLNTAETNEGNTYERRNLYKPSFRNF